MTASFINWTHPLVRGLDRPTAFWYLTLPQFAGGTRWYDLTRGTIGTLTNMAFPPTSTSGWYPHYARPGGFKAGLSFDNTDDFVALPSGAILVSTTPFTIAWWEYVFTSAPTFAARFWLDYTSTRWSCFRSSNASYGTLNWGPANTGAVVRGAAPTLANSVGKWNHMMLTGSAGPSSTTQADWKCYVNGVAATISTGGAGGTTQTSRIGAYSTITGNASLDDIVLWPNRTLTATEAHQWFASSITGHRELLPGLTQQLAWLFAPVAAGGGHGPLLALRRNRLIGGI